MNIEQIDRHNGNWWSEINFSQLERNVRRLQGRIYSASKKGDKKRVKNLMKLLARSWSARILAIYTITQKNKGRLTPGIDGKIYLTSKDRMELSKDKFDYRTYKYQPVLRRYIPKEQEAWRMALRRRKKKHRAQVGLEKRPLGLMTIKDRIMTTIISYALTAKWEALLDSGVMGFRPGRSTQDAIQLICIGLSKGNKVILDADINKFFDNIKHKVILDELRLFHKTIKRCLRTGLIENGKKLKTSKGITQGSPLSPILANIALHGLQQKLGKEALAVIYADDLIIMTKTKDAMKSIIPRIAKFLKSRGISLKRKKTKITYRRQGFNFLGFTIEQPGRKIYVKPQKERVNKFLDHLRFIVWSNKQETQENLILLLNPIIRGWTVYYRFTNAYKSFNRVDHTLWDLIWRWCKRRHKNRKGKRWIFDRYYMKTKERKWVFRVPETGYKLMNATDTKRLKYKSIVGNKSPLDPDPKVKAYWKRRKYEEIKCMMM